jgi:dTDP-4-dehydrorhamnose 3,5-epimerase
MKFKPQKIEDIFTINPLLLSDDRGYFTETYRNDLLEEYLGYQVHFVQENESMSSRGVLRGLHYQIEPFAQAKLIKVIQGKILDIAVDIRKESETYGKHVSIELTEENKQQVFIPPGFAHGFIVLSDFAVFNYKVDNYYSPDHDRGVAFDDKNLSINWQLSSNEIIVSDKDKNQPFLSDKLQLF